MIERSITVDLSKKGVKVKPLSGVCLGPLFDTEPRIDLSEEYSELAIPIVRTGMYDAPAGSVCFLDIHNIFPDAALDERFPESYDFKLADEYMASIRNAGADIYLRLGESRDKYSHNPTRPHVSYEKWARIAEKIILHYNKGWGRGAKYSVKYVEIWPGADKPGAFTSREDYFEFYRTVATHLKSAFPTLKVGGYSSGGFASLNRYDASDEERGYVDFLEHFLAYITDKDTSAPLDFLSWECRADSAEELSLHSNYAKNYLLQYKLKKTLSIVSSLKLECETNPRLSRDYPARLATALIVASDANIDMMFYSSLHPYSPDNAVITVDDCENKHKYGAYAVLSAFGTLLKHGSVVSTSDNFRREIYSLATASDSGAAIMVATANYSGTLKIAIKGSSFTRYSIKGMLGGGKRGVGYSTAQENLPLGGGSLTLKVGRCEIYLITLSNP